MHNLVECLASFYDRKRDRLRFQFQLAFQTFRLFTIFVGAPPPPPPSVATTSVIAWAAIHVDKSDETGGIFQLPE